MLRFQRRSDNTVEDLSFDGRVPSMDEIHMRSSVLSNITERSITPTTFDHMDFSLWQDAGYKSLYKVKAKEVVHFGINVMSPLPNDVVQSITECKGLVKGARSATSASGIKKIEPTTLEKKLLENAIQYLLADNDVVVVDIFHRDTSGKDNHGKINSLDNILPEVHSVVLYKNYQVTSNPLSSVSQPTEIIVIDPSNFKFSAHLLSFYDALDVGLKNQITIITPGSKDMKIYKPAEGQDKVGKNFDQWRDCTDVAIKIAFGLGDQHISFNTTSTDELRQSIINNIVIRNLSNNILDIDKKATLLDGIPVRIKQSSDIEILSSFNNLNRIIAHNREFIAREIKDREEEDDYRDVSQKAITKIINNADLTSANVVEELQNLHIEYEAIISDYVPVLGEDSTSCCGIM